MKPHEYIKKIKSLSDQVEAIHEEIASLYDDPEFPYYAGRRLMFSIEEVVDLKDSLEGALSSLLKRFPNHE